ncbi:SdrD B-like domain-containing protein [Leucobacter aridicollis]|uniref:SdrD B-like domain-containing protein n=1 Tax=Leucobacter aridicollis TaxID=283878 RepID=UPI00216736C9|nr:SdrD B-like domain-containing protein [Leucobacter aridicollis]MCS3428892.1 protocatechuate 3,4-dioxygenase beta subunit [Leucobacter aridicollis]
MSEYIAPRSRARIFINWLAGALVALLVVGGFSAPAMAAGGKFTVQQPESGETHNGLPVLVEGQTYDLEFGYGMMDDGEEVRVTLPKGISIPESALVVQPGNKVVESLTMNDAGELVVKFKNPFPSGINQGSFGVKFTLDTLESVGVSELEWGINGDPTTQTVIVTTPDNKPQKTETWSDKRVGINSIPHTVSKDGVVTIDASVLDTEFPYTVRVSSKDARTVKLSDVLDEGLALVPASLTGTKVVRDENGMSPVESPIDGLPSISGTSFDYEFDAEANSVYTFTYAAKIADADALAKIQAALQAQHDAIDADKGGSYAVTLNNNVTIAGEKKSAGITLQGDVKAAPSPGVGEAFTKSVNPRDVALADELVGGAKIDEPIKLDYTLGADLTVFEEFADNPKHKLAQNVVISDNLHAPALWTGSAPVLTDAAGTVIPLKEATGLTGAIETAIAADEYVNTYLFDGQRLYVNIGKDVTKKYTIKVAAELPELPAKAAEQTQYVLKFRADNEAKFIYDGNKSVTKWATTVITTPKDLDGAVIDDNQKFSKTTAGGPITVEEGTSVAVPYTFNVGANVGDAAKSRIIDAVDHEVFNVSAATLPEIAKSITGSYEGHALDGTMFNLSIDDTQKLVIEPNDAFTAKLKAAQDADGKLLGKWSIKLELSTYVLKGKQTLSIKNSASYEGSDLEYTLTSSSSTKATSYGDEMEVRKHVYVPGSGGKDFTTNFRAEVDEQTGELIKDEFTYRVELEPHGKFNSMVFDVADVLPKELEFLGFVAERDLDSSNYNATNEYNIPGSQLKATYDKASNTLTVPKGKLESGKTVSLYFKVKLVDAKENVGVTNLIGTSGATITPTNDYPLSLLKRDSADATKLITDKSAVFSVLAADKQTVVLTDLRVENGKIVTATGGTPVVKQPGTYWLREDVAPGGYKKSDELLEIGFKADDSAKEVVLFNDRQNYAIGDFTWIDTNRDGIQDTGEPVLPGVTVELIKDGKVIATTKTNADGRYLFDELPAGEYHVKFTLTEEQQKLYTFTTQNTGKDGAVDSDADRETGLTTKIVLGDSNTNLTKNYDHGKVKATEGIDPTWDAGVVLKSYAIGDYTWIDENNNGVQDEGEEILPGVTVELIKDGKVIDSTVTDKNGLYRFDDLPAGEYQVKFTLTEEQQKEFRFTEQTAGSDDALDSNANPETGLTTTIVLGDSNTNLTKDPAFGELKATEGIDPTWDAGVIRKTYAIGDFTWIDANRDGIQDSDEEILAGVTVELIKDGKVISETTTDDAGRYMFDRLPAGEYEVKFTLTPEQQKRYVFTSQLAGEDGTVDSNADPKTGLTSKIVLGDSNEHLTKDYEFGTVEATEGIDPTWDAGVVLKTYAIGDYTWIDANRDGIQDADEEILAGVTVELIKDGDVVKTTTTNASGHYMFDEILAGEYELKFTLTPEQQKIYTFTKQTAGSNDARDSNADRTTGLTAKVVLGDSNTNLTKDYKTAAVKATEGIDPTWDAGVVLKTYAIGDFTWIDANRDGVQDADEEILAGVTVELIKDGEVVKTTTTDENGRYVFDGLNAGEYQVKFTLTPEQQKIYTFTDLAAGEDDGVDSNADRATGLTTTIVLGDDNANLTKKYDYAELEATEGIDPTWDAGVVLKTYAIGDFTWIDANRDGIQDADEEILAGVTVELIKDGDVVKTTTTDETGHYMFDNLNAGEYEVKFTLTDEQKKVYTFTSHVIGENGAVDSNADRKTGLTTKIVLDDSNPSLTKDYPFGTVEATEGIDPTWDAGVVVKTYAVGDVVWIDANKNGVQDGSEKVLPGVTVELFQDGEVIATTTTDKNGRYKFDDLNAGEYQVKFTLTKEQQKIYKFTKQTVGSNGAVDSNAHPETGFTATIVLGDNNSDLTTEYEFGEVNATEGIDPTWDAGVVVIDIPAAEIPGAENPGTPGVNELPHTGGPLPLLVGGLASLLLLAGASLMVWRRRTA